MKKQITRFAPSPTGSLHLGNACSFVLNWLLANYYDWEIICRIEDLCGPRKNSVHIQETLEIMDWLGLQWQGNPIIQSDDISPATDAMKTLVALNKVYHCNLSRAEISAALIAPEKNEHPSSSIRPDDCAVHNSNAILDDANWRFMTDRHPIVITDNICGKVKLAPEQDFVIWTKNGLPAYQLAVVADDFAQGVTHVVRANDLLQSTAWQEQIYKALDWEIPQWWHTPLIIGPDNRKLAKRHGDTKISTFRGKGVLAERIIGLIAFWCGYTEQRKAMTLLDFSSFFEPNMPNKHSIVCTKKDVKWLTD